MIGKRVLVGERAKLSISLELFSLFQECSNTIGYNGLSFARVLPFAKDEARLPWLARTCHTPRFS